MNRLQEIEARMSAIASEVETRGPELTPEELDALETEVTSLKTERTALLAAQEKRASLLTALTDGAEGIVVRSFQETAPSPASPEEEHRKGDDDKYSAMEYRRAFMDHVLRGKAIPAEYRADEITHTTDVGAVIPTTVLNRIIEKMETVGLILPLITRTSYKGGVSIPTSSVKPVATWVEEGKGSDKQKKTTGSIIFAYHKLRCAVAVSLEIETMALNAFEAMLIANIIEAITKALEQAIISGDGNKKPRGILAETPESGQGLDSSGPSYEDLLNAEAALPQAYENGTVWCMSKKTFMQYYGLQDNNGQLLGRVNYGIAGKPERFLLGRPVVVCDYVPSFDGSLKKGTTFAFLFNFKDYALNTNYAMGIKKYEDNDTDDQVTKAVMLADGMVIDKGSLVTIKKKD